MMACAAAVGDALGAVLREDRGVRGSDEWVARIVEAVTDAANAWAERYEGLPVTVDEVARFDAMSMGYVDYHKKLSLRVAEAVCGVR